MASITTSAPAAERARRGGPKDVVAAIDDVVDPDGWLPSTAPTAACHVVIPPDRPASPWSTRTSRNNRRALRPEAVAIDIDLDGWRGNRAADEITAWCDQHLLWTLTRPGAAGHRHC